MARPVVEIDGLRELRKQLRKAGDDMAELKAANAEAAATVQGAARAPQRTGRLAGSVRSTGTKTAGIVRAGRKAIPYAGPIHYGWPARNIAPQPFLTTAAKQTEPTWVPIYEAHIDRILSQVKGKL